MVGLTHTRKGREEKRKKIRREQRIPTARSMTRIAQRPQLDDLQAIRERKFSTASSIPSTGMMETPRQETPFRDKMVAQENPTGARRKGKRKFIAGRDGDGTGVQSDVERNTQNFYR